LSICFCRCCSNGVGPISGGPGLPPPIWADAFPLSRANAAASNKGLLHRPLVELFCTTDMKLGCISYCGITAAGTARARGARQSRPRTCHRPGRLHTDCADDMLPGVPLAALGERGSVASRCSGRWKTRCKMCGRPVENLRVEAKLYTTWYLLGCRAQERGTYEFVRGPAPSGQF